MYTQGCSSLAEAQSPTSERTPHLSHVHSFVFQRLDVNNYDTWHHTVVLQSTWTIEDLPSPETEKMIFPSLSKFCLYAFISWMQTFLFS